MISVLRLELPIRTVSVLNAREHHMVAARRKSSQRQAIKFALSPLGKPDLPVTVRLTRISSRKIKDAHDNLRAAFKAVVDEVAAWLNVDDSDPRVHWEYEQEFRASEGMLMVFTGKGHMKKQADCRLRIEVMA